MSVSATERGGLRHRLKSRWRICVGGLVVTVALLFAATILAPVSYTAKGLILLTPPPTKTGANAQPNPYLGLLPVQPLGDVMAKVMADDQSARALTKQGFSGSYTVVRDVASAGPILDVTVTGSSPAVAVKDLSLVLNSAGPALAQLQHTSVAVPAQITAQTISAESKASASLKSQIRALVVAGVAGVAGTILMAAAVDVLADRRRRLKLEAAASDAIDTDDGAESDAAYVWLGAPVRRTEPSASSRSRDSRVVERDVDAPDPEIGEPGPAADVDISGELANGGSASNRSRDDVVSRSALDVATTVRFPAAARALARSRGTARRESKRMGTQVAELDEDFPGDESADVLA